MFTHINFHTELDFTLRILTAAILAGLIGLERERSHRAAGLRTYILVSIGSALFTLVGCYSFPMIGNTRDTARVAAQIVTGIGFLGAGTIIRQGIVIRGLTTAAGLWAAAAIGMACGVGEYALSFATTLLVIIVLAVFKLIETKWGEKVPTILTFYIPKKANITEQIKELFAKLKITTLSVEISETEESLFYNLMLEVPPNANKEELINKLINMGVSNTLWKSANC